MMDLTQAREAIDSLDREIAALLARRFAVVDGVSDYKAAKGLPIHDPAREAQVIQRLRESLDEPYQADVALLYERLFEISRARQQHRRSSSN